jgi:predicted alpha/beta-hydrolase family hydrolase
MQQRLLRPVQGLKSANHVSGKALPHSARADSAVAVKKHLHCAATPRADIPGMRGSVTNIRIPAGAMMLDGELTVPESASGLVLFAHGSGSSRHSPRNQSVARTLQEGGLATLLFDLLTKEEEREEARTGHLRFDISLLAERLAGAAGRMATEEETRQLPMGFFGASTGGAAALVAAARLGDAVRAVVSRGGRPDLAGEALSHVRAPTLLMVGGNDEAVIRLNEAAFARLRCPKELRIIPGAGHLFEEPGTLAQVAHEAALWFQRHLTAEET